MLVVGAFVAAAVPLIVTQCERGRGRFDQINFHEPAILRFAEQLPTPDVSNYLSATTPGYHLVLAVVARTVSTSPIVLQLAGSLFTVGLLALFTRWLTPRIGAVLAAVLGLGLAGSLYVFSAGTFLLPDNAGWLGVLAMLVIALRPRFDRVTLMGGGAVLFALVLARQSHLWTAGVLWAAAWLGDRFAPRVGVIGEIASLFEGIVSRLRRLVLALVAAAPAILVLLWFRHIWGGGLTVPLYQNYMQGGNPATPGFLLAEIAVIGVFHAGFWLMPGWDLLRTKPWMVGIAVLVGIALIVGPATTYDMDAGRYSGLWNIARKFPTIAGRTNALLLVLAPAGAAMVAAWLAAMEARNRWVMLAALVGFAAAVSMIHNAWQRYHEPMLLMSTAIMSALAIRPEEQPGGLIRFARWSGPVVLGLMLAGVTVQKFRAEQPVTTPKEVQEGVDTPLRTLWPEHWDRIGR